MNNPNNMEDLVEKLNLLKSQKDFEAALVLLNELYEKFPNSEEVKNILIDILFEYGGYLNDYYIEGYEKAKDCFEKITKISPNNYRAFYNLGIACFNLGNSEKAISHLQKALEIKPDYKYSLYNLGLVYEDEGKYGEALKFYEKALEIDSNFTYALTARDEMRRKLDELKQRM
ncbi:MAG: tetratricopeptide repeat protein [Candidatus Thorarchaeota archaeon]